VIPIDWLGNETGVHITSLFQVRDSKEQCYETQYFESRKELYSAHRHTKAVQQGRHVMQCSNPGRC